MVEPGGAEEEEEEEAEEEEVPGATDPLAGPPSASLGADSPASGRPERATDKTDKGTMALSWWVWR